MISEISDPDRLTMTVPRGAKFTNATQAVRLFLLVLLPSAMALLWWLADRDLGDLAALRAHGQVTLARIDNKSVTHGKSDSYHVSYIFNGGKTRVEDEESVSQDQYADTHPGGTLPVTFLSLHPETYRIGAVTQARIEAQQGNWLWGGLAAFVFFGLWLAGAEASFRQHLELLRDGSIVFGTVTERSVRPIGSTKKVFFVTYQFAAAERFAVASRSYLKQITCTQCFYEQMEVGQVLTILYDPSYPSRSIPYRTLTDVALTNRGKRA